MGVEGDNTGPPPYPAPVAMFPREKSQNPVAVFFGRPSNGRVKRRRPMLTRIVAAGSGPAQARGVAMEAIRPLTDAQGGSGAP